MGWRHRKVRKLTQTHTASKWQSGLAPEAGLTPNTLSQCLTLHISHARSHRRMSLTRAGGHTPAVVIWKLILMVWRYPFLVRYRQVATNHGAWVQVI